MERRTHVDYCERKRQATRQGQRDRRERAARSAKMDARIVEVTLISKPSKQLAFLGV